MNVGKLKKLRYPFILILGLCVYCLLLSFAESWQRPDPLDQHHRMGNCLIEVAFGEQLLDQCPCCNGLWFDHGELECLLSSLDLGGMGVSESDLLLQPCMDGAEDDRPCPLCHKCMRKAVIAHDIQLMVDVCPHGHGLWFEDGECGLLVESLSSTGFGQQFAGFPASRNLRYEHPEAGPARGEIGSEYQD